MKMMTRAIVWTASVLLALICLTLAVGWLWLNADPGRRWLVARINAAIPGSITIGDHRLSLLDPQVDLVDVVLNDADGKALASIARLHVDAAWGPLLAREIRIDRITVDAPRLDLAVDAAGRLTLVDALIRPAPPDADTRPTPEDHTPLPVNIVCTDVQVSDGRVTFSTSGGSHRIAGDGINLSASGDLAARQATLGLEMADIRVDIPDRHLPPGSLSLTADLDESTLTVDRARLVIGQSTLTVDGRVTELRSTPQIDGRLSLSSVLAELASAAGLKIGISGVLKAGLDVSGPPANPDADLVATVDDARIAGFALDQAAIGLRLTDRRVTLGSTRLKRADGSIELDGTVDLREAFPAGFLDPPANLDAIAYELNLRETIPDLRPWLASLAKISGSTGGQISIAGRGIRLPVMTANLGVNASADGLTVPGMKRPVDARLNLAARLDAGAMTVDDLDLVTDGIHLTGSGGYRTGDDSIAGRADLMVADLSRTLALAGLPAASGSGRATISLGGSLTTPQLSANLTARDVGTGNTTIGNLTVATQMTPDGRVSIDALTLDNGASHLTGKGRLRLLPEGYHLDPDFENHLELHLETFTLADFMASPPVDGRIDGRLQLDGPLAALTGALTVDGHDIKGQGIAIDALTTALRLSDGRLTIDRLRAQRGPSTVQATGQVGLLVPGSLRVHEDPAFDLAVNTTRFDPADFYPGPVSGQFTLESRLTGSVAAPEGRFQLTGDNLAIAGQDMAHIDVAGRLQDQRLTVDRFTAGITPDAVLTLDGTIGLDRTMDLSVRADRIPAMHIQALRGVLPDGSNLDLFATARGNLDNPDIDGQLTISNVVMGDQRMDDLRLDVSLHDMQARVTGKLNFRMDAAVDLREGDFDGHLIFDDTELAAYLKAAGQPDLHGTLTGRVQAEGNIHHMADASVSADLNQLRLLHGATQLVQSSRISMNMSAGLISVPPTTLTVFSTGRLNLAGQARMDGPVDLSIDGRLPLADIDVITDDLNDVAGSLTLSATISGNADAPEINARLGLEKIGMTVPGMVQRLDDINGTLFLAGNQLRIDQLTGRLDTGTFSLDGTVDHEHFTPTRLDLTARAQAVPIDIPDTLSLRFNGDVRLTGIGRNAEARGEIIILEGLYDRDVKINLLQLAAGRQRRVKPEAPPLTVPYFDTVGLDVAVGYRQPFLVENNLAQLEITPDLKIGGSLARPVLSGRAQVKSGTITFQGKTFDVKKGIIDFVNPYKTEPEIDIESQATIASWTVTLAVQGTPDNLDLRLSSVPEQTASDILSIILFGKPASSLATGEGGSQRTTSQIMAEMIADTFGDDIKSRTGMDILEVAAGEGGTDESTEDTSGVKVTVGKHLSDRLTVKYTVETKAGEVVQRATTEYQLLEYILVSGFQDTQGVYGSELVFRLEFR